MLREDDAGGGPYLKILSFHGLEYRLRSVRASDVDHINVVALVLDDGKLIQPLQIYYFDNRVLGDLVWVGDLDNDRKVDLLLRYYPVNGDGVTEVLYLSSAAEENQLVAPSATYYPIESRHCPEVEKSK